MGKLVIHLKQHTPLLHFQHGQQCATLRATEVKPKLDKFIKDKVGADKKLNSCFIGDSKALDYKMKIEIDDKKRDEYLVCSYLNIKNLTRTRDMPAIIAKSPYFAQEEAVRKIVTVTRNNQKKFQVEKWNNIGKKGLMWPILSISFFSLNQDVLNYIEEYIEDFFICTNFGTRNNKGFGSFTVSKIGNEVVPLKQPDIRKSLKKNFDFVYWKKTDIHNDNERFNILFSTIVNDYRLIKSGSGPKKSAFFEYAKSKEYRWDKPFIKSRLLPILKKEGKSLLVKDKRNIKRNTDVTNSCFVRPLLGLAGNYSFLLGEENNPLQRIERELGVVNVKHNKNTTDAEQINRFPSPLLFKVIDNTIYLVGNKDGVKPIINKEFSFFYNKNLVGTLSTPKDFNLETFLDFVFKGGYSHKGELNYDKYIDSTI